METKLLNEVIACLPKGKTHYRYYKNAYAAKLLNMAMRHDAPIKSVRRSRYAKLLNNVLLKGVVANSGDGVVRKQQLDSLWQEPSLPFILTAAKWRYCSRGWSQVSRPGDNLVLQLNMSTQHDQLYERYVHNYDFNPYTCHPVLSKRRRSIARETLAWSRIDFDLSSDEALIEEIQSDAIREMLWLKNYTMKRDDSRSRNDKTYLEWFEPYLKCWQEAMLMATVEFIRYELGISRIYIHTDTSGWKVKKMRKNWLPPKSLYSDLPRKFAFKQTWNAPEFLLGTRGYKNLIRKQPDIDFYLLDFTQSIAA